MSSVSVAKSPFPFLILFIWILSLWPLVSLAKGLSTLLIFLSQLLVLLILHIMHFVSFFVLGYFICLHFVLVRVSIPAQTSGPRSKLGRKGFIWLTLPCCCSSPRKSGLELRQVRKQELMQSHGGIFLTGLPPLACSACSLIEPKLPAQRWSHPQGAFPP